MFGDGMGDIDLSENVVVGDAGDVFPPQPKKEPSFDAPGDFGGILGSGFCIVVVESSDS